MFNAVKNEIISQIKVVDLAKDLGLKLEHLGNGKFDYRCRCPFAKHKNGSEKTASLYINSNQNDFYCFGCNTHGNSITFYKESRDISFSDAMKELSSMITIDGYHDETADNLIQPSIFSVLLDISKLFREFMLKNPDDLKWINNVMKKTDEYIDNIDQDDVEAVKELYQKILETIKKRAKWI